MKKLLIFATLLISLIGNAQTKKASAPVSKTVESKESPTPIEILKFKFNADGSTEFFVYPADKMTAAEIYTKVINWVNETYKNPDAVIKGKVENEMVRLDGFSDKMFTRTVSSGNVIDYGAKYTIEVQIQDGKYRIKYTHNDFDIKVFFTLADVLNNVADKNGNAWSGSKAEYEASVQKLFDSLNTYITKPKEKW